jgi:uridine kinase
MSTVIAIAGAPGSGKTTLALELAGALPDAAALHMDNYEQMTRRPLDEVAAWLEAGAPFDAVPMQGLDHHLAELKRGIAVTDPASGISVRPARHIVFETQFGRAHRATGRHIDLLVWLDTPPDVALARSLRLQTSPDAEDCHGRMAWIDGYLAGYVQLVSRLVALQRERVRPAADVVLDGLREPRMLVRELLDRLPMNVHEGRA